MRNQHVALPMLTWDPHLSDSDWAKSKLTLTSWHFAFVYVACPFLFSHKITASSRSESRTRKPRLYAHDMSYLYFFPVGRSGAEARAVKSDTGARAVKPDTEARAVKF